VEYFNATATAHPQVDNLTATDPAIVNVSGNEYWVISDGLTMSSGATARIGLRWDGQSQVSAVPAEQADLRVMAWNDGASGWDNAGASNFNFGAQTLESGSAVAFSERIFTLGSISANNPLPVDLVDFTGKEEGNTIRLQWTTASEINNDRFEIHRSYNGLDFEKIGEVTGAGDSKEPLHYGFVDMRPFIGKNYYRLRQVDFDGQFEYSKVILVNFESSNAHWFDVVVYPNPVVNREFTARVMSREEQIPVVLRVYDAVGATLFVREYHVPEDGLDYDVRLGLSVKSGMYFIEVHQGNAVTRKKIILSE
jgi:hypothetical protein